MSNSLKIFGSVFTIAVVSMIVGIAIGISIAYLHVWLTTATAIGDLSIIYSTACSVFIFLGFCKSIH